MKKKFYVVIVLLFLSLLTISFIPKSSVKAEELVMSEAGDYDVVVYGGSSAAVTAAIAAKRDGASVIMIADGNHIGGLTSSGLGATDMANRNVVGGIAYEFYNRVYEYYKDDSHWTSQTRDEYFTDFSAIYGGKDDKLEMQWVFEPKVAEQIFIDMLIDDQVPVIFNERLDLEHGVVKENGFITKIITESGKEFRAKTFIDATYEGDLMAKAGVTYTIGRESNDLYHETMNGILPNTGERDIVSPYVVEGDPDSGLLPFIEDKALGTKGESDSRVQAYCFRFTLTSDPNNMIPITKPENYHPEWYETRGRKFLTNPKLDNELTFNLMPNLKTDINHADFVGMSYEYADGDYLSRESIKQDHRDYVLGILYFYAYDERVPMNIRVEMRKWGLAKDEFQDNDYFPTEIYLREGRRMISDYVMKESDVIQNSTPGVIEKTTAPHSIGQGFYWFDSHRVAYFKIGSGSTAGVQTDGNFWSSRRDYPISYESVVPTKDECKNLFVPICLSSTHAAYGSIRMETTYMIVAESCGTAASMSANEMKDDSTFAVQDLNYARLAIKLANNGQKLGDIIADDLTGGELSVLKLQVAGLVNTIEADALIDAFVNNAIDTPESVNAVKTIFKNAAARINKKVKSGEELVVLTRSNILVNSEQWEVLFQEELPASLSIQNTASVLEKIAKFFASSSTVGYLYDWLDYFLENELISEEQYNYFTEFAWGGKTTNGEKTYYLLTQLARALNPNANTGEKALQTLVGVKIISNQAVWVDVFNNTIETVNGSNLNGLLKNAYNYFSSHESEWNSRMSMVDFSFLVSKGLISEQYETALLANASKDKTVSKEVLEDLLIQSASYVTLVSTVEEAISVLENVNVSLSTICPINNETDGALVQNVIKSICTELGKIQRTTPLEDSVMNVFLNNNILTASEVQYFVSNAVTGKTVIRENFIQLLEYVAAKINSSESVLNVLLANNIITDEQKVLLQSEEETLDGVLVNTVMRNVSDFVKTNNLLLSEQQLTQLVQNGFIEAEDKQKVMYQISLFGQIKTTDFETLIIKIAKVFDNSITTSSGALDCLEYAGFITNALNWSENLVKDNQSGVNTKTIIEAFLTYYAGSYQDLVYIKENDIVSDELFTYLVRCGVSTKYLENTKVQTIILGLANKIDSSVTDGASAIQVLVNNSIISSAAAWQQVFDDDEGTVLSSNVLNIVNKSVRVIMASTALELSDEVLDFFAARGYIKDSTTYNKAYFKANAKIGGGTLNQGETQNMLIRAFRGVSNGGTSTGQTLCDKVTASGFTFSDDATENETLRDYWYARIKSKNPVDGEMLRVLMIRIYDFLNQ